MIRPVHRVGDVDGGDDDYAEPGLGHEGELRGEAVDRAAVAEPALAEALLDREAEAESGVGTGVGELGLPHGFEGFGGEQAALPALQLAAPEHDLDEAREVQDGRVHAARGGHPELEGGRVVVGPVDAPHVGVGEVVDDVGFGGEGAVVHADGGQDRALHVVREGFALCDFERVAHHRDPRVRVLDARLGLVDLGGAVEGGDGGGEVGARVVEVVAHGRFADKARAVRHELAQGDGRAGGVVGGEVGEVVRDGRVDVEFAALVQLHDGDVGEELRHRADAVDGGGGGGVAGGLLAEPGCPRDALFVDERDGHGGEALLVALALDHGFECGGDFGVVGARGDIGGGGWSFPASEDEAAKEGEQPGASPLSMRGRLCPRTAGRFGRVHSSSPSGINASAGWSTPPCRVRNHATGRPRRGQCRGWSRIRMRCPHRELPVRAGAGAATASP